MSRAIRLFLPVALFLGGCVSGLQVKEDYDVLKAEIELLEDDYGRECAPEALARAEAERRSAQVDMKQGDAIRAAEEIDHGLRWVRHAMAESETCRERMRQPKVVEKVPVDSDGDGIMDDKDACADAPEDFDGHDDVDGCPETEDQDNDGITDDLDRCPTQAEDKDGDRDDDGCPDVTDDRDGDGIADTRDTCPDQAEDTDGFQDTDGCPDVDNDGDGIFDVADRCPGEAEDVDGFEDSNGCPDPDNDRDGLADAGDECPNEAETMNGFEDSDGCPDTDLPQTVYIENQQIKIKEQIHFETGKAIIKPESYGILNDVATVLATKPTIKLRIEGHTDNQGSEVYNLNLSKARAEAVREYLVKKGVAPDRLRAVGLGESTPLDSNDTESGRAVNRRVEFHITEQ